MNALATLLCKDWRVLLNLRRLAREQSRFKALFILAFGLGLLAGLWALFLDGFRFLSTLGGIGVMIVHHLFALFFFGLGLMLILSNIITAYATLFRSDDIPFLLLRPAPNGQLALHKLLETSLLSSWAFFFVLIPFIGAFAWQEQIALLITLWTFLFSIPFVLWCAGAGMLLTLLAVRWLPRFRPLVWAGSLAVILAALFLWQTTPTADQPVDDVSFILARLIPGLQLASWPLWPSWWVAEGIMSLSRGQWLRGTLFFGVLSANVLLMAMLVEVAGRAWFYTAWQKTLAVPRTAPVQSAGYGRLSNLLRWLPTDIRAVILKDLRTMLRDPVQWTQGFLFFGLLALYFFNLRNFHYHLLTPVWRNTIAFLNMFSLSAVMCSFCSRFVYPQLSLEGHGFWILGLSATTMGRVLIAKFGLALVVMLVLSAGLMGVSTGMLDVNTGVRWVTLAVAAGMSLALCGLAMGLGAIFLDLKQRNPLAIISGFGGTLNLALSLGYMVGAILPFAMLFHADALGRISSAVLREWLLISALWLATLTAVTTLLPLLLGRASLMQREY